MKIALIGYGRMGKEIEKAALAKGHEITLIIDNDSDWENQGNKLPACDVAVEFSVPGAAVDNIMKCLKAGVPVVTGTTGWFDHLGAVVAECNQRNGTLFYASNFSIGVNIVLEINRQLAKIMNAYPEYNVHIQEVHHIRKLDAPSGTALTLARGITSNLDRKKNWSSQPGTNDEVFIDSVREGDVTGIHRIFWDSEIDTITVTHEAKSRMGFVTGALAAAAFVQGRKGVLGMQDLIASQTT